MTCESSMKFKLFNRNIISCDFQILYNLLILKCFRLVFLVWNQHPAKFGGNKSCESGDKFYQFVMWTTWGQVTLRVKASHGKSASCLVSCNFIKKETLSQVFSCEFCEIFKNTFFTKHLWETASAICTNFSTSSITLTRPKLLNNLKAHFFFIPSTFIFPF